MQEPDSSQRGFTRMLHTAIGENRLSYASPRARACLERSCSRSANLTGREVRLRSRNSPRDHSDKLSRVFSRHRYATAGFTLLELLVVIAIISLLAVALVPTISQAMWRGEETETQVRMTRLVTGIEAFERCYGIYPPDDFRVVLPDRLPVKAKADAVNSGIESLVIYLSWQNFGGISLDEHEDWLRNTDGDDNEAVIPMLDRTAKVEVVDAWGTPFAYFHNRNYNKAQSIMLAGSDQLGGDIQSVQARRNPRSAGFLSPRKFQLISAGKDLEFGTEDDLVHPPLPTDS